MSLNFSTIVPCRKPRGSTPTGWHEDTHVLHAELRNHHGLQYNALYKDDGKAFLLLEPKLTLNTVAQAIPQPLRGMSYNLYLIQQQRWWNDRSLYILDELGAYLSGSRHPQSEWSDYLQATEFIFYSYYLISLLPKDYPAYIKLISAIMWATEDAFQYSDHPRVEAHIAKFKPYKNSFKTYFPTWWFETIYD